MRTVDSYRGVQVHILDIDEDIPTWVRQEVGQGRAVMARGDFQTTSGLAHILDRYLDETLRGMGTAPPAPPLGGRPRENRR